MPRFSRLRTAHIAYIAILAILWHALMPLAHAASLDSNGLSSICTTGAPRQELIQLPSGQQDAPAIDLLKQCPLCVAGAHIALSGEPTKAFSADAGLAHVQATPPFPTATHIPPWLHFSPRAPPQA